MSRALLDLVPLNSRCSRKWLEPEMRGGSSLEPASTQKPSATERTLGIRSVTTRSPEVNSVRRIGIGLRGVAGPRVAVARATIPVAVPVAVARTTLAVAGTAVPVAVTPRRSVLGLDLRALGDRPLLADRPQRDLAAVVDVLDLDLDRVPHLDRVLDVGDPLALAELRDVDQPVAARHEVHERAERRRVHD